MSRDGQENSNDAERSSGTTRKPWFGANRSGAGWHPQTWQGWLILLAPIAAIVVIIVLAKSGSL
jgi:hypothetical protein